MKEHDDLMDAIKKWIGDPAYGGRLMEAYIAYKAAPKPLVLEVIEWDELSKGGSYLSYWNLMYVAFSKAGTSKPENKCYRLPENME